MRRTTGRKKTGKKPKSRLQHAIEHDRLNSAAGANLSNIKALLTNFETRIAILKKEIKIDTREMNELEKRLIPLRKQRDDMEQEKKQLQAFVEDYNKRIGHVDKSYDGLEEGLKARYDQAKLKYAKGIQLLIKVYGYHPTYKRWHDTFSSTPWKPL
mmetsp:Transcript_20970/g.37358  ORF Transcript_20970/g.37358 Transcript_20970/m.37358 type:complete len:156 (+) Transcript_20970:105-572(+)|eukprot:CAMPEP_0197530864 /NCGR_PEP_ID=MMETSP1318-20131121/33187_1 /TAXON_ID=552666 /ORGANISM="Partenskyella glossopodia, Strain RCC365" /LENGTH=155 /DNA_ID=CAMNT_0043086851 /DNA_START=94 /DNA_END=561 /DNA_ORIENTATION=+